MAGRKDIEAGKSYVTLYLNKSALVKGLQSVGKQMQSFGVGISKMGGMMAAAGGAIVAPVLAMANQFSEAGDAVQKMAIRTGMTAEAVSELAHAAGLSATDIETLEKGVQRMQRTMADAARGETMAVDALSRFGLAARDLEGLSPDEQMERFADAMAGITDPAQRTAAIMEVFGRSGAQLIPMFEDGAAGIQAMREEARRLGLVIGTEDADAAAALNDAMGRVQSSLKAASIQIGAALAPALTWLADTFAVAAANVIQFIRDNRDMIVAVTAAAAAVAGVGTAIVGLGGTIAMVGTALSGLATLFGAVLSPIGLLVAAIAGATAAFVHYSDTGRWLAETLMGDFGAAFATIRDMIGGITDALAAGDIGLAAQIAMTGLKAAFLEATQSIRGWWISMNKSLVEGLANAANAILGIWRRTSQQLAEWFADLGYQVALWSSGQKDYLTDAERTAVRDSALNAYYDDLQGGVQAGIDDLSSGIQESLDASLGAGDEQIQALRDQLAALRSDAGQQAEIARREREAAPTLGAPSGGPIAGATKPAAAATFSAAALVALGRGSSPMDRLVKINEEQKATLTKQLKQQEKMAADLTKVGALLTIS